MILPSTSVFFYWSLSFLYPPPQKKLNARFHINRHIVCQYVVWANSVVFLCMYVSSNDAMSSSAYELPNGRMTWITGWEECARKWSQPNLRFLSVLRLRSFWRDAACFGRQIPILLPWRCRQEVPPKPGYLFTTPHVLTSYKAIQTFRSPQHYAKFLFWEGKSPSILRSPLAVHSRTACPYPEDGGSSFLWNVVKPAFVSNYTALYSRRQ
jgi:hypothetical protein